MLQLWNPATPPGEWNYVWTSKGDLDYTVDLVGQDDVYTLKLQQLCRRSSPSHRHFHGKISIPRYVPEGMYTLHGTPLRVGKPEWKPRLIHDRVINLWSGEHYTPCAPNTMFLRCTFIGVGEPPSNWPVQVKGDGCCFIDCTFRDTLRGPLVDTGWNRISGVLFAGTTMVGLDHGHNMSEGILVEGPLGLDSITIVGTRYSGAGHAVQLQGPCNEIALHDLRCHGAGVWFMGDKEQWVRWMANVELLGGALTVGPSTSIIYSKNINAVGGPLPSRWNNSEDP